MPAYITSFEVKKKEFSGFCG